MAVKFYYDLISPSSRALSIFFKLAGVPIEEKPISIRNGDHLKEGFSRLHQLPVIQDEEFQLSESLPIIRYLVGKYPVDDFWYPKEAKAQARVDEFFSWAAHNMYTLSANSIAPEMTLYRKFQDPLLTGPGDNQELAKNLQIALDELEEFWTESTFITGNCLSIADVFAACEVEQSKIIGVDAFASRPRLAAWFQHTRKQLEPQFTEQHQAIYRITDAMKN